MACRDRFLHQPSTSLRQGPQAASRQIPQAFVSVAGVKKDHALAGVRVVKSAAGMLCDELTGRLPPRSIRRIEDFVAKLFELFNGDDSDRFRDGFPPIVIDSNCSRYTS